MVETDRCFAECEPGLSHGVIKSACESDQRSLGDVISAGKGAGNAEKIAIRGASAAVSRGIPRLLSAERLAVVRAVILETTVRPVRPGRERTSATESVSPKMPCSARAAEFAESSNRKTGRQRPGRSSHTAACKAARDAARLRRNSRRRANGSRRISIKRSTEQRRRRVRGRLAATTRGSQPQRAA